MGQEVVEFVQDFQGGGELPKAVTASFLALIPKCDNPLTLKDYRPICLINGMSKIISKILVARFRKVMARLIYSN